MDVNGTRFHLLLGPADWRGPGDMPAELAWNEEESALELAALPFVFPTRREETPPGIDARRGAGRDRFGNWYWIDEQGLGILARGPRDSAPRTFWPAATEPAPPAPGEFGPTEPPAAASPRALQGLVVTTEHYLVAGSLEPAGLLLFDLAAGGPPVALEWPEEVASAPWDMAAAPDGGVWILDRANQLLWSLDRHFRVRSAALPPIPPPVAEFVAVVPSPAVAATAAGEPACEPARPVTLDSALDVFAVPEITAVEALCDGSALLLGVNAVGDAPALHRWTLEGAAGIYDLAPLLAPHRAAAEQLPHAHDFAFVADTACDAAHIVGTIYLVAPNGNQAFAFRVEGAPDDLRLSFSERFYPMRRFGGRAVVAAGGEAHYDSGDRWVTLLEQPRTRYETEAAVTLPPAQGEGEIGAFDGRVPGCVWHRLLLDACIPPGSAVLLESRVADSLAELRNESWREEPAPYLRGHGRELPWSRPSTPRPSAGAGTWELLFQASRGRYLQLRATLRGNGRSTPRLHALRVYYPRFSYLREYLPAVWREDASSASFLDRYLANVEGTFTEIEGRIAAAQILFDTRTAPAEFLDWLAGWLGASLDAAWDERKRRFFLANALRMYADRGTREGIVRALRLALEDCPDPALFESGTTASPRFTVRIVERFLARTAPGVAYEEVGTPWAPATTTPGRAWSPAAGAEPLDERWRVWLAGAFETLAGLNEALGSDYDSLDAFLSDRTVRMPAIVPAPSIADAWHGFVREALEFTYDVPESVDLPLWRDFLQRRYRQIGDLNRAWRRHGAASIASFDALDFPAELPTGGAELADWITFVSVVLQMRRAAHRFTILVPARLEDPPHVLRNRRELVARLAALEKPAHTVVQTRLYWAAFQVGTARLGSDSVLGPGSRFSTLVLGRGELGETSLGWTEPWNVRGRRVVGRDPVTVRNRIERPSARCS